MFHIEIEIQLQVRPITSPPRSYYTWPPRDEYHFTGDLSDLLICRCSPTDEGAFRGGAVWGFDRLSDFPLVPASVAPWKQYAYRFCARMNMEKPPKHAITNADVTVRWSDACST